MKKCVTNSQSDSTSASVKNSKQLRCPWAYIVVVVLLLVLFTACLKPGPPGPKTSAENENVLRLDINAPFTSLNPAETISSGSTHIFPFLYSHLFVPLGSGLLEPDLALKWSFDSTRRQWIIHLRDDARFHDRRPVIARDVKFSLDNYISKYKTGLKNTIKGINAKSDHLITIDLNFEDPNFLKKIWDIEIVPKPNPNSITNNSIPIGSGPFRFHSKQGQRQVSLTVNYEYYHKIPSLNLIQFNYQPDREKAWLRLLSGAIDIGQEISPKNYHITRQYSDRFYFDTYTLPQYTILLYNTRDPLFSDVNVRRALTLAIDRNFMIKNILNGFGRPAAGPMGVDSPFKHPRIKPLPFDPTRAIKLLSQAGWRPDDRGRLYKQNKPFDFILYLFKESHVEKKVARYIQLCLYSIGITIKLKPTDFDKLRPAYVQNDQFQAVLTELRGAYREPEGIKMLWSPGNHGRSYAGDFEHPEISGLIEKTFREKNLQLKKSLLQELDQAILSLQPGTFLFHKTGIDAMSRRFSLRHPFALTYEGEAQLKYARVNPIDSL